MRTIKYIVLFIVFTINYLICDAKNDRVLDSLLLVLKEAKDDNLKAINDVAEYYLQKNDTLLFDYLSPEKLRSFKIIGTYYIRNRNFNQARQFLNTALNQAETPLQKADILIKLSELEIAREAFLESLDHLRQAKTYLLNEPDNQLKYKVYYNEGYCYFKLEDFSLAQLRWGKAASYAIMDGSKSLKAEINLSLGQLNIYTNNYYDAFYYLNSTLQILQNDSINACYAYALNYIGDLYFIQENYIEATQYYELAGTIFELINEDKGYAEVLINKGKVALIKEDIRDAYSYFQEAKNRFKKLNSKSGIVQAEKGLAHCLIANGDYAQAKQNIQHAYALTQTGFSDISSAEVKMELSSWFYKRQELDSALFYANSALENIKRSNNLLLLANCYSLISDIFYNVKNYKSSVNAFRKSIVYKDSIDDIIHSQEYKYLQSRYEVERKQTVIEVLTQEKHQREESLKLSRATIEQQKAFILLGIIILAFLIIIAFILGAWLNQKRKDNIDLQISNKRIAQQKEEIEAQKQHLQEANAELERLSIIARETDNAVKIMNPVGRIIWVNEGFTRMYGFTLNDMQKIENMGLLGSASNVDINSLVSVWYGDKKPITFESKNKRIDGDEIWVQTTLTPILDQNYRISKMIAIDTDISKLKKAEAEIISKNMDITASISYAKKIQEAIMLPAEKLLTYFPESFCFYKPKSIVSGDFYWFSEQHERIVIACADSTGHGVPGAFMSLIGISFLNKIVNEKGFVSPSIILNRMRNNVITHLHHTKNDTVAGDGMDMSVITIDKKNQTLEYAGAMNPMYIIRNGDLIELKPDRMPVGFFDNEDRPFSSTSISLKQGDHLYLFTDGYYDQFGGISGSKLKTQRFKELLKSCFGKKANVQQKIIEDYFNDWKGEHPQVDDILVMGILIE